MKIEVNGSLTFDELMNLASHGKPLFNNGLEKSRFPVVDISKRIIDIKLFMFNKSNRYDITKVIIAEGFRSLYIEELLTFSYLFPDKQKQYDIFSLYHYKYGNHGELYPCLTNNDNFFGRQIKLSYIDGDINFKRTRFITTKNLPH